ncbi:MAG: radical SAM family heme chaperone HemW [Pseudomonadota bacterium]
MEAPPLGLYVHLPWCIRKCPYCDFNSHEQAQPDEEHYVARLLTDLEAELESIPGREIRTVFIGGGTPSLFSAKSIAKLMEGIRSRTLVPIDAEVTLEANPGSVDSEKFQGFREAGVSRLSIGIQSFNDDSLRALGRVHDATQAYAAVSIAKCAGFNNINLDLMHGLPGQSEAQACEDLHTALSLAPSHISWYQLTIEQNTAFFKRPPTLPIEDELANIQDAGEQLLATSGFNHYEVSAYSKPNSECQHNLNYWQFGDYLGIGAGAHGKLTDEFGTIVRYAKTRKPEHYLARPQRVSERVLCEAEIIGEYMMNALRLKAGFDIDTFAQRTGVPYNNVQSRLDQLEERQLLSRKRDRVVLTNTGWRFLDSVIAEFMA